jgi:hypothetical protein|tara:strand:- start:2855 stop:3469 length:615 start_codon:yes stop_codon:yes gene_type:complete
MSKHKIPTLTPASESDLFESAVIMPQLESGISIPTSKSQAVPKMSSEREVEIRANTIKTVSDINGENIEPSHEHQEQAKELAREMMTNKKIKPEFGQYPNETMAFLAGLVGQTNCMIVEELADLKLFVVNNFVQLAAMAKNDRDKLAALRAIGEIDGVDAFKKKTEITHITKSGDELEKELLETIEQLKGTIVEGEVLESKIND